MIFRRRAKPLVGLQVVGAETRPAGRARAGGVAEAPSAETRESVLARWRSVWGSTAPLSHLMRWDWPDRVLRFHSLPNHERLPETEEEREEIWDRFLALHTSLRALHHSEESLLFVLGRSRRRPRRREGLGALAELLPPGSFLATWSDGEDEDQIDYDIWLHVGPLSVEALRALSDEAADDAMLFAVADESCSWCLVPYDGGFDVLGMTDEDREMLREGFSDWLPLPEQPYGSAD